MDHSSGRNSAVDTPRSRKRFISYRLRGEYEKPWLQDPKFKRTKVNNYIIYSFIALGIAAAGAVAYLEIRGSLPTEVCPTCMARVLLLFSLLCWAVVSNISKPT